MTTLNDLLNDITGGIAKVQSPYLYLQAAGSDYSDYSASGIHLRWDLMRSIGETHIPKGNLASGVGAPYPAAYGFNKADDFVELLRVPYIYRYPCTVNFSTDFPVSLVETGPTRVWRFDTVVNSTPSGEHCTVLIRFNDIAQYDLIRSTTNPTVSPYNFVAQYTGIMEAEVQDKLCFVIRQSVKVTGSNPQLRMESVSTPENISGADLFISCRQLLDTESGEPGQGEGSSTPPRPIGDNVIELTGDNRRSNDVMAENIVYFRFDYTDCVPLELRLETYEQFILGSIYQEKAKWQPVGSGFSLTDQDSVALARLQDSALNNVNNQWPRYFGTDISSGLFTASVPNYQSKWNPTLAPLFEPNDQNGLKRGVINYLTLSQSSSNALAVDALPSDNPNDQSAFDISYMQMLKIVALDFHIARMLGLGHIDANLQQGNNETYIYLSIYHTTASLETGEAPQPFTHLYMTLPTSRFDYRLPPAPVQDDLTFGISVDNGTGTPLQLTDANGYTPFADSRIINLNLEPYDPYQAFGPFFTPPDEFCTCNVTKPVFYGIKYKLTSETDYRVPEISNDDEFSDASGVFETAPIPPQVTQVAGAPNPPLYTHEEKENGEHLYAIYGINWFSRVSPLSNPKTTITNIPVRRTLLPPSNFSVQLIQPEDPQILTTIDEQNMFVALTGDSTLVRLTFEWNHNHYIPQKITAANTYADKVQFFFRQEPPRPVSGMVQSVTSISSTQVQIQTQSYTITSVSPPETVIPKILPGDETRFIGSIIVANQVPYVVDNVIPTTATGDYPSFILSKQLQSTVADLDNTNQFSASVLVTIPAAGDRFLVMENMNEPENWVPGGPPYTLAKEVEIINFTNSGVQYTETVPTPDAAPAIRNIGGIYQSATITEFPDVDGNGNPIPASRTGMYTIEFDTYQLAAHPDPDVSWYKGTVRILEDYTFLPNPNDPTRTTPQMKVLDVWRIETQTNGNLKLTVYDPTLDVSAASYIPQNLYTPIEKGTGIMVNFHPGYRVYLKEEAGVLDESTTLPAGAAETRQTYLSTRSKNTILGIESFLHTPVVMPSRKILIPLPPAEPLGPLYATRPNFYGKSTWTMNVGVTVTPDREPYAMVFYRANERSIVDALYAPATADGVLTDLAALPAADAVFSNSRWKDLVNVTNLDSGDGGFAFYIPGGYRFPTPNKTNYVIPGTTIQPFNGTTPPGSTTPITLPDGSQMTMVEVIQQCIEGAFLPLTEAPPLYRFMKTGTQTSPKKPVIRDSNNDLLPFSSPLYDPSPMIVRYTDGGNYFVRFTDYTLDGASKNIYFYYAVEMNDEMKIGPRSPIAGPIKLVNAYPAEQPGIRKITSVLADQQNDIQPSVKLELNPYVESENITRIKLYRANNNVDATSVRTMTLAATVDVTNPGAIEVVDTFADQPFPLFGDPLFYRLVALRGITNEFDQPEEIPSKASDLGMAMLADVINPPAPVITATVGTVTATALQNVSLSWNKVAYNATYYLYEMTAAGNWHVIFQVKTNDQALLEFTLPQDITKVDADGNTLYSRYKVKVENASGLINLTDKEITL